MPDGYAMEAEPRHADFLAAILGPRATPLSALGVREPGQARDRLQEGGPGTGPVPAGDRARDVDEDALSPHLTGLFRAGASRANYLALGRRDIA